ncbi:patatin-like phospholipase family protein [Paenibacillus crassostreae]|uniref:Patatin n=1 Tax=Paenibacillus crassostreae TaxID=1763538 RepID=A0A167DH71_9BACL|nr:patatin-like phospholipase family protein [Paenibacillus crassostreae]AOZ91476.1 patatin [Paenibacillus crassostreae]OAB74365.1 patatin [Paenibacillus crassostreae]
MLINAVFEGGGVRGISLAGAVQSAEQADVVFQKLAGTSSGAIVASLLAAGYTSKEMKEIIQQMPFSSFLTRSPVFNTKYIGPPLRVMLKKGLYSGEALEQWIRRILMKKNISKFSDLPSGKLQIIASDITNGRILIIPDGLREYGINPDTFEIAKAIRMSTSIPYFFDPVMLRLRGTAARGKSFSEQFIYIVDGGLLSNFPLWLFDNDKSTTTGLSIPTIGFQMVGKNEGVPRRIRGPFSMLQAMVETMLSAHDERYIEQDKSFRTIKIPTLGVTTTNFHITKEESMSLFASGYEAGNKFFGHWKG